MVKGDQRTLTQNLWTRNFIFICLSNLAVLANIHSIMPTIPLYVSHIGGNEKVVGFVVGIFTITAMLTRPVAGMLLDKLGRKFVLFAGVLLAAFVSGSYIWADTVILLLFVRLVHGIAFSMGHTAVGTITADILPPKRLGEGIGYFSLTSPVSMAVAPAIALVLAEKTGFFSMFAFSSSLAVLAMLMSLIAIWGAEGKIAGQPGASGQGLSWSDFVEAKALPASMVLGLLTMLFGAVVSILVLFAKQNGIANIGLFFTINALAMIVCRPFAHRWYCKNGPDGVLLTGVALLASCALIVAFSTNIIHLAIAAIAYGVGFGFCIPVLQTLAIFDVLPQRRGTATGTFFTAFDLGIGAGAIIWGWAAAAIGYRGAFLLNLIPIVLAGLIYYSAYMRKHRLAKNTI